MVSAATTFDLRWWAFLVNASSFVLKQSHIASVCSFCKEIFQQNPGECHSTVVKNILKYLSNTKDMFLVYGEVEYIVASEAIMEVVWIRKFIYEIKVSPGKEELMEMYCDTSGASIIPNEPGFRKEPNIIEEGFTIFEM
ncbi:hypothetical protein Tco_0214371 [Tanacetum coccineum]